ncbi:EF-hand domain-containing protein [Parerythrobacter aestuarii]|uniref:EF-hand domain-containing protein n=1 Tax=Parerythrobacter aestuarii TaxID=3020909 RepID=UPI0024DE32A4|nr:EF-hand domain-containing protein [Parerythrobacter aestuarii]
MNRVVLGAVGALLLVGVGLFWWQGRAVVETGAPPPLPIPVETPAEDTLPVADVTDLEGPEPPEATELTREQRRFFLYDRNRDLKITRREMLSSRTSSFRKLDVDGNNLLTFEEWAVATVKRFEGADANGDLELTPEEFATTAPKRKPKKRCNC